MTQWWWWSVQNAASEASIQGALVENNEVHHDADEWTGVKPKPCRKGRPQVDVGRCVQRQNTFSLLGYENPENSVQGQLDAPSNLPQGQLADMLNPPVNNNQAQSRPENENLVQNAASEASILGARVEKNEVRHDADEWTSVKPKPCRKGRPQVAVGRCVQLQNRFSLLEYENPEERS
ncbi:hypothetical protein ACLB2K_066658 [Fragaria x ananassa]